MGSGLIPTGAEPMEDGFTVAAGPGKGFRPPQPRNGVGVQRLLQLELDQDRIVV